MFSVTSADFIEAVGFVAKFADKKDNLGSRCLVECFSTGTVTLTTSYSGLGAKFSVDGENVHFGVFAVSVFALSGAADMLKKSKTERITVEFDKTGTMLVIKAGKSRTKIPTFPHNEVYNLPEPIEDGWGAPSKKLAKAVVAAKSFTSSAAVGFRPFELVYIDKSNISIIESALGVFFSHESGIDVSATADYKYFGLIFDEIDRVQVTDRSIFFGSGKNWCVIPRSNKPSKNYKPLLDGMQKNRKAAISLNVVAILELQKKISAMMKIDSSVDSTADLTAVHLEVLNEKELGVSTATTSTSIEMKPIMIENFDALMKVGIGFFNGLAHSSFVGDDDTVILEFGEGFVCARSTNAIVYAGLRIDVQPR